jgi:hypothetical protein
LKNLSNIMFGTQVTLAERKIILYGKDLNLV